MFFYSHCLSQDMPHVLALRLKTTGLLEGSKHPMEKLSVVQSGVFAVRVQSGVFAVRVQSGVFAVRV